MVDTPVPAAPARPRPWPFVRRRRDSRTAAAEGAAAGRSLTWDVIAHATLIGGAALMIFPVWMAFVASTHPSQVAMGPGIPLTPGPDLLSNYSEALVRGAGTLNGVGPMMFNSLVMALGIAVGKIIISILSAYAIVFFRFPLRAFAFWIIFMTLMLPVEVRIFPTVEVVSVLDMRNSYSGLIFPLIASATATFLFRQFFRTIPDHLVDAGKMDGFGPWGFFWKVVLPLSRTNVVALFIIMFIYGWNQYLLPLLVADDPEWYTIVIAIKGLITDETDVEWHLVMATAILALLPPAIVVLFAQRLVVKGLVEPEK
jgi:sn-glycerol 3-phosphate transport system permease protein